MEANDSISVAMCTYNGERFLNEQLESIANQTLLPLEIVVCDDGSIDATVDIVTTFAKSAPFSVRLVRNACNLGSTRNFEQAIQLCRGDLIALCDQDDIWDSKKLSVLAARFADASVGGVFSNGYLMDECSVSLHRTLWQSFGFSSKLRKEWQAKGAIPIFLRQDIVTGAALMFRAQLRQYLFPISPRWVHDAWIVWVIAMVSRLEFVEAPLIRYRVFTGQQEGVPIRGIRAHLRSALQSESTDHLKTAKKYEDLRDHIVRLRETIPHPHSEAIQSKVCHSYFRSDMSRVRVARLPRIVSQLSSYIRYSRGMREALKDLMHS